MLGLILSFILNQKMLAKYGSCWWSWPLPPILLFLVWILSHCSKTQRRPDPSSAAAWAGSLMLTQEGLAQMHLGQGQGESKGGQWA